MIFPTILVYIRSLQLTEFNWTIGNKQGYYYVLQSSPRGMGKKERMKALSFGFMWLFFVGSRLYFGDEEGFFLVLYSY